MQHSGRAKEREKPQVAWLPLESWLESLVTDWHIPVTFGVPEFNSRYLEMSSLTIFGLVTWGTMETNRQFEPCQALLSFEVDSRTRFSRPFSMPLLTCTMATSI